MNLDWSISRLLRTKLAIRQTSYAILAIFVIGFLLSLFEVFKLYGVERDQLIKSQHQQIDIISVAASRAAFHVDDIQAAIILEGLFIFKNVEWAQISTDFDLVLAEKRRPVEPKFSDPLGRFLFKDFVSLQRILYAPEIQEGHSTYHATTDSPTSIGIIELRSSPVVIGRNFLNNIETFVYTLIVQFILLGVTLAVIFQRTLTKPLLSYAQSISQLTPAEAALRRLDVPEGHENDELGAVVAHTNQLLERIEEQHQDLLHHEKIATLGGLLASVSHELNNPLAILAVQSELLVETAKDDETRKRGEKIQQLTNRCSVITHRFLTLARRRDPKLAPVAINLMIDEVLEILDHHLERSCVRVTKSVAKNIPLLVADRFQITQVLLNLIINAEQAIAPLEIMRQIIITADIDPTSKHVKILIADNGKGIPHDAIEKIFQPFYTTKREGQGTGLGLSYAFDVVQSHKGSLITSKSPLGGAAFILTLPISPDESV